MSELLVTDLGSASFVVLRDEIRLIHEKAGFK